ncbi:hypothetical protein [Curtobacterium sp. VKM Ac-2861]|uniref:hypothetical protein n=1 Tax=Curtobacterium sp. VKM Ac-2861 TaxID=2739016 RepID=UPI001566254E
MPDDGLRHPRRSWPLGLALCCLVFLEVFATIGSLPGMLAAQLEQYTPCASDVTLQCSYAVGETAQFLVPLVALIVTIVTWVFGASGPPTIRRRVLTPDRRSRGDHPGLRARGRRDGPVGPMMFLRVPRRYELLRT